MPSPWKTGLSWKELASRLWKEFNGDDVLGQAAKLSYYFLLALFPMLIFLTALLGMLAGPGTQLRNELIGYIWRAMPPSAAELIQNTLGEVSRASGGAKLGFGILATLWAATGGMSGLVDGLNAAYAVKESRPWWKAKAIALGLTVAVSVLVITALGLVLYGPKAADFVVRHFGYADAFALAWKIVQWPLVIAFVLLALAIVYYFAPNVKEQRWRWITPGAVLALFLWFIATMGLRVYLTYFNSYAKTYGSLGAVIILMLWFYLTGVAILTGAELNSIIENAAAERGAPDAKLEGEKAPGERHGPRRAA